MPINWTQTCFDAKNISNYKKDNLLILNTRINIKTQFFQSNVLINLLLKAIQVLQNNQFGIQNRTTTTETEQSFVELFGWRGNRG